MLNELWKKAQEMTELLNTPEEDIPTTRLKIYINLLNAYLDRLYQLKRERSKQKALNDQRKRAAIVSTRRHINKFKRFIKSI